MSSLISVHFVCFDLFHVLSLSLSIYYIFFKTFKVIYTIPKVHPLLIVSQYLNIHEETLHIINRNYRKSNKVTNKHHDMSIRMEDIYSCKKYDLSITFEIDH